MIYITGDLHGIKDAGKFLKSYFQQVVNKKENTLIVLGDSGFSWPNQTNMVLKFFDDIGLKCKIVSILGNNDNYDDIYARKQFDFAGGKAVCIDGNEPEKSKIMYLMNGYVYNFEGRTFAVLGGADSYDAPFRVEAQRNKFFAHPRTEHKSWWKEELPSVADFERLKSLLKNNKVDFMLSHDITSDVVKNCFPWSVDDNKIPNIFNKKRTAKTKTTRDMLDAIDSVIDTKLWLFGHHHKNYLIQNKLCVFDYFVDVNNLKNIMVVTPEGENLSRRVFKSINQNKEEFIK